MAQRTRTSKLKPRSKPTAKRGGSSRNKRRSILWRARRALFLVGLFMLLSVAGAGYVIGQVELPDEDPLLQSTFICAANVSEGCGPGNSIATLAGEEDRVSLPISEIPQVFINAVLAAEDRKFFTHNGIDPLGIARALYRDLRNPGAKQGGSTITQQYAKTAFLTSERTVTRKFREAVLAIKLERELNKEEILERYLNTVYFGRGAYGAEAAARAYFDISIREVNISQAAYLAALIRSPETADVTRDPETAEFRRNSVLDGMAEMGTITKDERDTGKQVDLVKQVRERSPREGLGRVRGTEFGTEYYVEQVRRLLYEKYGADRVNGGGLRVYTSLNMDYQRTAYESVYGTLDADTDPLAALVSIDDVGRVVAMVGGKDFGKGEGESQVNLALGKGAGGSGRGPGSAMKPFTLATALDQGNSAYSRFRDKNEMVFPEANAGEDWKVTNYSEGEERILDLIQATQKSSNTVYAQLIQEVGPTNVVQVANRLGISTELPAVPSLTLGTGEVSVLDMANAYSSFARRGQAVKPIFITKVEQVLGGGEVNVLEQATGQGTQVIQANTADQVNHILQQVVHGGTGSAADFGIPVAGKTGTTQDYRDAWFVGYTPKLTTAVWMGYDNDADNQARFMRGVRGIDVTGGSFPAQIWRQFMQAVTGGQSHGSFVEPNFSGEILNEGLQETTTTLPRCGPVDEEDSSATTAPCRPTTTTSTSTTTEATTTTKKKDTTSTTTEATTTTKKKDTTTTTTEATTTTKKKDTTTTTE